MTASRPQSNELRDLLWSMEEGTLSATGINRIDDLVRGDADLLQTYAEYMRLVSDLRFGLTNRRIQTMLASLVGMDGQFANEEQGAKDRKTAEYGMANDRLSIEQLATGNQLSPSSPTPSFFSATFHGAIGCFSEGWPLAYLIATVVTGLGILTFWLMPVSRPEQVATHTVRWAVEQQLAPEPLPASVGRITGLFDCKWNGGSHVSLGQKCQLASGLMEITYDTGAKVILQGPVTYEVEANGGYLSVGKLTGKLEKRGEGREERGEGAANHQIPNPKSQIPNPSPLSPLLSPLFVIRTPTAIVTDLGTEFGVVVNREGGCEAQVFYGVVEVRPIRDGKAIDRPRRIVGGQVAVISPGQRRLHGSAEIDVVTGPADSIGFARVMPTASRLRSSGFELIQNGEFLFVHSGHADGDCGGHVTTDITQVPHWATTNANGLTIVTDPQNIFIFMKEYFQVQTEGTWDLFQKVTVGKRSAAVLSMRAALRRDGINQDGTAIVDLYPGNVTSFNSATPLRPVWSSCPRLRGNGVEQFDKMYNSLSPGDYTVRIGGTANHGTLFQVAIDRVSFAVTAVPEPTARERGGITDNKTN